MKSVVSYPYRGKYGNKLYRGNCSGFLIKELLEHFKPKLVFDPMEGSGTARDVCREMKIRYIGKDIKGGFYNAPIYLWTLPSVEVNFH